MPGLADVLSAARQQAEDANAAKQRGLYADPLADGTVSLPSAVTEGEAAEARAREAGASAALLHDQDALARLADPPEEALALANVIFGCLLEAVFDDADAVAAYGAMKQDVPAPANCHCGQPPQFSIDPLT